MIVVTGNCLSSGYEMLDPIIFKADFKKLIALPEDDHFNTRMAKIYDTYLRDDPKFEKMNNKSIWVRNLLAQKKIRELNPGITIETLIPDFQGINEHIDRLIDVKPEVISHNIVTGIFIIALNPTKSIRPW